MVEKPGAKRGNFNDNTAVPDPVIVHSVIRNVRTTVRSRSILFLINLTDILSIIIVLLHVKFLLRPGLACCPCGGIYKKMSI